MKIIRTSVIAVVLCAASSVFAEPLKVGISIDMALDAMKKNNYEETALSMGAGDTSNDLKFWNVDEGVLIAVYSKNERKIMRLSFWFADNRSISKRKEFDFSVNTFDPDTGVMTLQTKKISGEQAAPSNR